jgi:hypothetical protein
MMSRKECADCPCWTGKVCGFAVVEGRGKCRLVDEVVGFGVGWVSPYKYEEGEERE